MLPRFVLPGADDVDVAEAAPVKEPTLPDSDGTVLDPPSMNAPAVQAVVVAKPRWYAAALLGLFLAAVTGTSLAVVAVARGRVAAELAVQRETARRSGESVAAAKADAAPRSRGTAPSVDLRPPVAPAISARKPSRRFNPYDERR
jgi:hypothetical protein